MSSEQPTRQKSITARGQRNHVWVELDPESKFPIRIIKSRYDAYNLSHDVRGFWPRSSAVREIRRQVFERDGYECRRCGAVLTLQTGHMDEIKSRGEGGEVSLDNCWLLCADCHIGNKATSEHGNRRLQFGGSK